MPWHLYSWNNSIHALSCINDRGSFFLSWNHFSKIRWITLWLENLLLKTNDISPFPVMTLAYGLPTMHKLSTSCGSIFTNSFWIEFPWNLIWSKFMVLYSTEVSCKWCVTCIVKSLIAFLCFLSRMFCQIMRLCLPGLASQLAGLPSSYMYQKIHKKAWNFCNF